MKTIRVIAFFGLMLSIIPSFSQERGFFRIYSTEGRHRMPYCAIETEDGSFIVAINDGTNSVDSIMECGEIVKLSAEGELVRSVPVNDENALCFVQEIFRSPSYPRQFIGTGFDVYSKDSPYMVISRPYLIHFDDDLNITFQKRPDWPEGLMGWGLSSITLLDKNGKLFNEYCMEYIRSRWQSRRFYATMTVDGDYERMVEDSTDLLPVVCAAEALFEYPVTKQIGMLRFGYNGNQIPSKIQKLFRVNDDMEAEQINELYRIAEDTTTYYNSNGYFVYSEYCAYLADFVKTTILPLNDSTLLFASIGDEHLYQWIPEQDTNIFRMESSAVMFKTDLEGNVQRQCCIVGSWNDSVEAIPRHAVDITKSDAAGHKDIYHCCNTNFYYYSLMVPNTLTVTKLTEDFDILWRRRYALPNAHLEPNYMMTTSDGGCLVVGRVVTDGYLPYSGHPECFALKLEPDGTVGTDEITVTDEIFFYPNPARDVLHLHYPQEMQPTQIELYDLQGRLVRTKTSSFESLSMEGLAAGQYVLKVTLENGKVYTDKVVKE